MNQDLPAPITTVCASNRQRGDTVRPRANRCLVMVILTLCGWAQSALAVAQTDGERPRPITPAAESRASPPLGKSGSWVSSWLALSLVLVLMTAGAWAAKRSGYVVPLPRGEGPLQTVARLSLDPRTTLLVTRCGARLLILGLHPGGVTALGEITDPEEVRSLLTQLTVDEPAGSTGLWTRFLPSYLPARNAA